MDNFGLSNAWIFNVSLINGTNTTHLIYATWCKSDSINTYGIVFL